MVNIETFEHEGTLIIYWLLENNQRCPWRTLMLHYEVAQAYLLDHHFVLN